MCICRPSLSKLSPIKHRLAAYQATLALAGMSLRPTRGSPRLAAKAEAASAATGGGGGGAAGDQAGRPLTLAEAAARRKAAAAGGGAGAKPKKPPAARKGKASPGAAAAAAATNGGEAVAGGGGGEGAPQMSAAAGAGEGAAVATGFDLKGASVTAPLADTVSILSTEGWPNAATLHGSAPAGGTPSTPVVEVDATGLEVDAGNVAPSETAPPLATGSLPAAVAAVSAAGAAAAVKAGQSPRVVQAEATAHAPQLSNGHHQQQEQQGLEQTGAAPLKDIISNHMVLVANMETVGQEGGAPKGRGGTKEPLAIAPGAADAVAVAVAAASTPAAAAVVAATFTAGSSQEVEVYFDAISSSGSGSNDQPASIAAAPEVELSRAGFGGEGAVPGSDWVTVRRGSSRSSSNSSYGSADGAEEGRQETAAGREGKGEPEGYSSRSEWSAALGGRLGVRSETSSTWAMRDDESEVMSLVSMCATDMSVEEPQQQQVVDGWGNGGSVRTAGHGGGEGGLAATGGYAEVQGSGGSGRVQTVDYTSAAARGSCAWRGQVTSAVHTEGAAHEVSLQPALVPVILTMEETQAERGLGFPVATQEGSLWAGDGVLPDVAAAVGGLEVGVAAGAEGGGGTVFDMGSLRDALVEAALVPLPDDSE